jgi:ribosomal protein L16 Arg81 hydroxylase
MSKQVPGLAGIIAPVSADVFFAEWWEKHPLHVSRAQPDFYAGLLTKTDVDRVVSSGGLRFPSIQLAKDGGFFPAEAFTRTLRSGDEVFAGVPNLDQIRAAYRSGATISLPGFHRAWAPLGSLVERLEAEISHAVHTNIYLTPGNTAGFAPHFDTHEVFILQIAGRKTWTIHPPPLALPHRTQSFDTAPAVSSRPILSVELAPGDMLYLPRGFVHSTATSAGFSLHVTLGVTVYTWVELLFELLQAGKSRDDFRRALPIGFARDKGIHDGLKRDMAELFGRLHDTADYDALVSAFSSRILSAQSAGRGAFESDISCADQR